MALLLLLPPVELDGTTSGEAPTGEDRPPVEAEAAGVGVGAAALTIRRGLEFLALLLLGALLP